MPLKGSLESRRMEVVSAPLFRSHRRFHPCDPGVNVLAARGLMAMDGENVAGGFEGGFGFWREFELFVIAVEAGHFGGKEAIQINLGIFVVMHEEAKVVGLAVRPGE